jgi:hyperosmotically inducible protein
MMYKRSLIFYLVISLVAGYGCTTTTTPDDKSASEMFDSSFITAKIKARLIDDPVTGVYRIKVSTNKGIVELSGTVNSDEEKAKAEMIARTVEGVTEVHNKIQLGQ